MWFLFWLYSQTFPIHSETRTMCPLFGPRCTIQTMATISKDLTSWEKSYCHCLNGHIYGNVVINKRPIYTSLNMSVSYIWLTVSWTSGCIFPELLHLQSVQEISYNSTELSYKTFLLLWGNKEIRAWIPGSFTCSYNYFDLF